MSEYLEKLTISEAFYHTVNLYPERSAQLFNPDLYYGDNNGHFTWKEMAERVETIASALLALGLEKKDRVAIAARNSPYWTQVDAAVINCGGVLVTIYPTLSTQEMSYIANDSSSRYLFVGSEDVLSRILPALPSIPSLEKVIVMDMQYQSSHEQVISLSQFMELGQHSRAANQELYQQRWQGNKMEDWATILYTSGTTGNSKGVILSHHSLSSRMDGTYRYFKRVGHPINAEDRTLSFLPLAHIFDRGCSQWAAIWVGASIAYADSPATLLADLLKYNPTWFSCVPRLYEKIYIQFQQQIMSSPVKAGLFQWALGVGEKALEYRCDQHGRLDMRAEFDLKSRLPLGLRMQYSLADRLFARVRALFGQRFRFAFSASAGISPELLKFFYIMGLAVLEGYGLTETTSACTYNPMFAAKPGTVGPQANDALSRAAADGELEISGAGMFVGYLNKPEEDQAAFTEDGWFRTGDIVEVDETGYYRIVDRKKAIICLATGKNVAPAKIESLFATSPVVEQIFAAGDEKPFTSALIVPNFSYFIELFRRQGIKYDESQLAYSEIAGAQLCVQVGEDFISQPDLQQKIAEAVEIANRQLEDFEAIKKYTIIARRFTEDNGELTPTQKTKKRVILEHYRETINSLYS